MDARAQVLVQRHAARVDVEAVAEGAPERLEPGFVAGVFAGRQQFDALDPPGRALRVRVEGPDAVDFLVEQVESERRGAAGRKQVDDRAADGELAGLVNLLGCLVAGVFETAAEGIDDELLAGRQCKAALQQVGDRRQALQQRADRRHDDAALERRQPRQGLQARGDNVGMRRERIVRQRLVVRKGQHR